MNLAFCFVFENQIPDQNSKNETQGMLVLKNIDAVIEKYLSGMSDFR